MASNQFDVDRDFLGSDMAPPQRGVQLVEAINRMGGASASDNTVFLDGAAFSERSFVGTWTVALGANGVPELGKAAATQTANAIALIGEFTRLAAERGLQLVSADLFYEVATAAATDVQMRIIDFNGSVAAGVEPGLTILAGDVDADYDEDNDTAAERGAIAINKLTVTIPTDELGFLGGAHAAALDVIVTDPGTAVFTLHGAVLRFKREDLDVKVPV